MSKETKYDIEIPISAKLDEAIRDGYIRTIEINPDWVSFRHPDYPLNSASLQEGRFNNAGETAYYLASGDYCGQFEVPNFYDRIPCGVKKHTVFAFDLASFAENYNYHEKFIQQRKDGGWDVCQEVSDYLTNNCGVSGLLYQSAACHKEGQYGVCMAILPAQEQTLPKDFFFSRNLEDDPIANQSVAPSKNDPDEEHKGQSEST